MAGVLVGAIVGALLIAPVMLGAGAGTGIAVGMKTAACIMQEAEEAGIVTAEQAEQIRALAAAEFGADVPEGESMGGPTDCATFMDEMRAAASE
ncbi:hypothetical protein SAMN05444722_2148 [Rhodovulum sp. ES.010]|uniref:hypothetical protein n=1 Tax=Rhodovulum sp. ES.010 TaxID=1882821 RepID=UPI00092AA392|nr:hypothetical protein [Rhodovulum sp. ES.010]SIO43780.1 hypothetical protein SAMN05444722_2148 [Rhodovulum sp. ES.010]